MEHMIVEVDNYQRRLSETGNKIDERIFEIYKLCVIQHYAEQYSLPADLIMEKVSRFDMGDLDATGIFALATAYTVRTYGDFAMKEDLPKLKRAISDILNYSQDYKLLYNGYVNYMDTTNELLSPVLRVYMSGWFDFVNDLVPYIPKPRTMTMPPVVPVVWLQYLVILQTAEELSQSAHAQITQDVKYFLRLCRQYWLHEFATRHNDYILLMQKVLIFYCIRTFCMKMIKL